VKIKAIAVGTLGLHPSDGLLGAGEEIAVAKMMRFFTAKC
jgi:hypothetical protein